jgi:hypothetical protein
MIGFNCLARINPEEMKTYELYLFYQAMKDRHDGESWFMQISQLIIGQIRLPMNPAPTCTVCGKQMPYGGEVCFGCHTDTDCKCVYDPKTGEIAHFCGLWWTHGTACQFYAGGMCRPDPDNAEL